MSTQHTPGPWEVHGSYLEGYPGKRQAIYTSEMEYVAVCDAVLAGSSDDEKNNANARLIAAAPTLLKHLEKLVGRSDNGDIIEPGWYEIEDARDAIAEAKGD